MDREAISQTLQTAALSALSNIIAQAMAAHDAHNGFHIRTAPLLKYMTFSILTTPLNIYWQRFLERQYPSRTTSSPRKSDDSPQISAGHTVNLAAKFAMDQTFGAAFNIFLFIGIMGLLNGASMSQIRHNVMRDSWKIYVSGCAWWPAVSLISFALLPLERRVIFGSAAGLVWGVYLSFMAM
ncbi:hypothetical protein B0J12DRAFT_584003 [Macrophomina phaseolina]|uniref:Mpv17/PMP22 n=1 Tax=Macrophomina phaseolina TaxID=35725 RepID=A0ABQ8FV83_9PEZI|nr:hypothetical protein B0J12DRAFT_584003 [Macrophomina phaseolina]